MSSTSPMSEGRVTLVTGASQGIGRAIAIEFGGAGDEVVLVARNRANLEETARQIEAAGGSASVVVADVTDESSVDEMVSSVVDRHGGIDVLVNNSGVGGPSGMLWDTDPAEWRATFEVNVFGVYLVTRAVLPVMIDTGSGSVIIIGSISGKRPLVGRTSYSATKTALIGLTRTLSAEAGPSGIRVNLISPGFVDGPRLDWVIQAQADARGITAEQVRAEFEDESVMRRLTQPEDVARTAVFLASEASKAITGADINVNSGVVMY